MVWWPPVGRGVLAICTLAAVGCGSSGPGGGGSGSEAAGAGGVQGGGESLLGPGGHPFGYGKDGYGFDDFGDDWGEAPSAEDGFPTSTGAQVCEGYASGGPVTQPPELTTCEAQQSAFETGPIDRESGGIFDFCFDDGTPEASIKLEATPIPGGLCGDGSADVLAASGSATFGGGCGIGTLSNWDWSAWDGVAMWVRADVTTRLSVSLSQDQDSDGCYSAGDDWDGDGHPNLSYPPQSLWCTGLQSQRFEVGTEWRFLSFPWSAWETSETKVDTTQLRTLTFMVSACTSTQLWIASIGPYRAVP